jgi:signal transduction histidine kinase
MPVVDATISLYNNLGVLYNYKGNTKKALEYFLNDVKISDQPKFLYSHIESLLYLGIYYNDIGDDQNSVLYLKQALALAKEKNLPSDQAEILVELASVTNKKDHSKALAYLTEAREIGEYIHSKLLMVKLYKQMANIYEQQGNYKEALSAMKIEQALDDSITEVNRSREMSSLSATYELKRSNAKIKKLENIYKNNMLRHKMILTGAGIAAVFILVFFIIYINTRRLNKKLRKSETDLKEINNTKNKLLSIIGHDLKGPVAMIPAVIDICNDESTSEEERQMLLHTLKEHTLATVDTLDKLLYWGQSILKGTNLKQEDFNTKPLISSAIRFKKISLAEKKIELTDKTQDDLKVTSELAHFDFVIRNLLANAIKFTGRDGRIVIDADLSSKPGMAVFSVQDTGIGIDKERLKNIFEPFHSKDGTANEKGTGIGLMLCKEFANKNGGDIWVESEAGKGSKFFYSVKCSSLT